MKSDSSKADQEKNELFLSLVLVPSCKEAKELLASITCQKTKHEGLCSAVYMKNLDLVKSLAPVGNAKRNSSRPLGMATQINSLEITKALLPFSNPKANQSAALYNAVVNANVEMASLLIPLSNPKALSSRALSYAVYVYGANNSKDLEVIIDLLYPVSDVPCVISDLEESCRENNTGLSYLKGIWQAREDKKCLEEGLFEEKNKKPLRPSKRM